MSTFAKFVADGTTQVFTFTFPYLDRTHVKVRVNGIMMLIPADYDWLGLASIRFHVAPLADALIEIRRETPSTLTLINFQNGATLSAEDLNVATLQNFYRTQEIQDQIDGYLSSSIVRFSSNGAPGTLTPEQMIEAVAAEILASQLANDLQQRIGDIDINAEAILEQTTRLNGIDAVIVNGETARIEGDLALAQTIALLGAVNGSNTAFVLNTSTAMVDASTSLASKLTGLEANIGANSAAILSEASARISGDTAVASSVTTLQATVNGQASSISTIQNVVSGTGGLTAQYMVKLDVNGRVSGFGLYNTGASSDFIVIANRFAIVDPAAPAGTPKVPFSVSGGVVFMQNVVIQDALIQNLTINKLTQGTLNADMNIGTGRVIYDNGTVLMAQGLGFGTANQFIYWFGPRPTGGNLALCSEANATEYRKTNGNAYFGGSLSAGTLKTSGQTSDTTATATITIGPFGTNGNPINVVLGYSNSKNGIGALGLQDQSFACSASIVLYRTIAPGSEVSVATLNVSGNCVHGPHEVEQGYHTYLQSFGGSVTYTDTAGGTGNRTYRATMSTRSVHHGDANQSISVIATE